MPTVRAKFKCDSVEKRVNWNKTQAHPFLYTVKMSPVVGQEKDTENSKFWEATPAGILHMESILPDAFEPGKEYYVDFTPAE
jgi:hypothetical protein